jgi:hypothetical protein
MFVTSLFGHRATKMSTSRPGHFIPRKLASVDPTAGGIWQRRPRGTAFHRASSSRANWLLASCNPLAVLGPEDQLGHRSGCWNTKNCLCPAIDRHVSRAHIRDTPCRMSSPQVQHLHSLPQMTHVRTYFADAAFCWRDRGKLWAISQEGRPSDYDIRRLPGGKRLRCVSQS